jgi:cyanate permease
MWPRLKRKLDGWKTIIWNGFLGVAPVVLVSLDKVASLDLSQYMTWWLAILIGFIVSAIGVWLRYITTGPVGVRDVEAPDPEVKGVI